MTNWFNRWLLALIVLVTVPFWWLLIDNDRGGGPAKPVHIADLRKLAAIIPGARPTAVTETVLATHLAVGDFFAAGIGLKRRPLAMIAWSLPVPGKGPIVIDPGTAPVDADSDHFANIDRAKLSWIEAETKMAGLVLQTQGSFSTAKTPRGTMRVPYLLGGKAGMVTLASRSGVMASAQPSSFTTAQAVAPGAVAIPAFSHAPDTRLIFIQLADGREFLFTGDVATLSENWFQLRLRSHLAALWGPLQDDDETYAWLRTIRQLHAEAPHMEIVPGHDYLWLTNELGNGTVTETPAGRTAPPRRGNTGPTAGSK